MLIDELSRVLDTICSTIPARYSEYAELNELNGKICAENVFSPTNVPHADRSLRDGIAYNTATADLSKPLRIVSELSASQIYSATLSGNKCVFLSTGSYLPLGADAVIPVENTIISGDTVTLKGTPPVESYVEKRGAFFEKDSIVMEELTPISYRHVEMLATLRINSVKVLRMPRIGILSTGSEITDQFGDKGFIVNSNYHGLSAFLKSRDIPQSYQGVADDDNKLIISAVNRAIDEFDALITFGGTAKGLHDVMGRIVEDELGGKILVNGIKATPGKTFRLAVVKGKPLFMLPGTPAASLLCEELFLNVWIMHYKGFDWRQRLTECEAGFEFVKKEGFGRLFPCTADFDGGKLVASHIIKPASLHKFHTQGVMVMDSNMEKLSIGDKLPFIVTGGNI